MKSTLVYRGDIVPIYSIELCHYGDNGDFEVFPVRDLGLDIGGITGWISERDYNITYADGEVAIFYRAGIYYTFCADGRLILEGLKPGTDEQALGIAIGLLSAFDIGFVAEREV